jgi:hypothetical protein
VFSMFLLTANRIFSFAAGVVSQNSLLRDI